MFTAKIEVPGKEARFITNCTLKNGKLVSVYRKGVGKIIDTVSWSNGFDDAGEDDIYEKYEDAYKPYFNSTLFAQNGLTIEDARRILKENGDEYAFTDDRFINCMFTLGENENGYFVYNYDELKEKEEVEKKKELLNQIKEETGFDFIQLKTTYSRDEEGKTSRYHYLLKHESGAEYKFSDCNIFDFGRCINPEYEIDPEWGPGGLMYKKREAVYINDINELVFTKKAKVDYHVSDEGELFIDNLDRSGTERGNYWCLTKNNECCESETGDLDKPGRIYVMRETDELWWHSCAKKDEKFIGWRPVRKVEELELVAYNLVKKYGHAYREVRM